MQVRSEIVGVLLLSAQSICMKFTEKPKTGRLSWYNFKDLEQPVSMTSKPELDKCKLCVQFAQQATSSVLNIILNMGVVGGCSDLCGALGRKTGSTVLDVACNVLCDVVGVEAFVKIVQKADLNPIYLCELLPVCPVNDYGDALITSLTVKPSSGPQGKFHINFLYSSQNGTGTGEIFLRVDTLEGMPIVNHFLHEAAPAGKYMGSILLKAVPDPNIDPYHRWLPGIYNVTVGLEILSRLPVLICGWYQLCVEGSCNPIYFSKLQWTGTRSLQLFVMVNVVASINTAQSMTRGIHILP